MWIEILNTISLIGDICIIIITFVTTYLLLISRKITLEAIGRSNSDNGYSMSFSLKNHSMRDFYIKRAYFIFENKRFIKIDEWDEEQVHLVAFGTITIKIPPFSRFWGYDFSDIATKKGYVRLDTNHGVVKAKFRKTRNKSTSYPNGELITIERKEYNGKIVMPDCKYALVYYRDKEDVKTAFIFKGGYVSENLQRFDEETKTISWFNGIPTEIVDSYEKTVSLFKDIFAPLNIKFTLVNINEKETNDSLNEHKKKIDSVK
jgi:hypothetical protein